MNLTEADATLQLALRNDQFVIADRHRALRDAANVLIERTKVTRTTGTQVLTANNSQVSLAALTTFRAERLIWCELARLDRGTWTTTSAYAVRDIVVGDGTPDAKLYTCNTAHTAAASNEPGTTGGSTYWSTVASKRGNRLSVVPLDAMLRALEDGELAHDPGRQRSPYYQSGYSAAIQGEPRAIAFDDATTLAYVWPAPDAAYYLGLTWWEMLTSFTIGTTSAVALNLPDEYLWPVLQWGAPALLEQPDPADRRASPRWQMFLAEIVKLAGRADPNRASQTLADGSRYLR